MDPGMAGVRHLVVGGAALVVGELGHLEHAEHAAARAGGGHVGGHTGGYRGRYKQVGYE